MSEQIKATLAAIYDRRPFSWLPRDSISNFVNRFVETC